VETLQVEEEEDKHRDFFWIHVAETNIEEATFSEIPEQEEGGEAGKKQGADFTTQNGQKEQRKSLNNKILPRCAWKGKEDQGRR